MTTKREYEDRARMFAALERAGVASSDAQALRRISMTLHRWHEHECNNTIQRDPDANGNEGEGKPYAYTANGCRRIYIPDRERGALKRLAQIMARYSERGLTYYVQGDPRGCALYILRPGDVPAGEDAGSYYSRGISVY